MNLTSTLARIELNTLSDPDRRCADAVKDLDHISTLQEDGVGGAFEKSLRIKNTIDTLELQVKEQPSWGVLAALVNSEYRLWILNAGTPIRHNPFLSHWVEAIQRLEADVTAAQSAKDTRSHISAEDVAAARLAMIKGILENKDTDVFANATPRQLYDARHSSIAFDIRIYICMLEEEGIYEPSPRPPPSTSTTTLSKASHKSFPAAEETHNEPHILSFQDWKQDLLSRLTSDSATALEDLTRLPIALPALDFLTTLLLNRTLKKQNIDSAPIITSYIQHGLRLVEHMGQPPGLDIKPPHQTVIGIETDMNTLDHGREAQSRAVRLLLLFIKNLIRKELVGPEVLYFEIQEICVRYVWIKEVREFRTWVEEGGVMENE